MSTKAPVPLLTGGVFGLSAFQSPTGQLGGSTWDRADSPTGGQRFNPLRGNWVDQLQVLVILIDGVLRFNPLRGNWVDQHNLAARVPG